MHRKILFIIGNLIGISSLILVIFNWSEIFINQFLHNWIFWILVVVVFFLDNELWKWVKTSKRSGTADLMFIMFMFLLLYFITQDFFIGILGGFAVYMIIGSFELRKHDVINKVVLISTILYNTMFFAGLVDFLIDKLQETGLNIPDLDLLNKVFALSLWIILILGFIFFGRKYIIVWRFMSPQYISMAIYLLSWVFIATIGYLVKFEAIFNWIGPILMLGNVIMYAASGILIDKFLGVKPASKLNPKKAEKICRLVENAKEKIQFGKHKIKVGYGDYPIINAMAYGPFFDKRICIIAPADIDLPEDELESVIAHELAHLKLHHPSKLLILSTADIIWRSIINAFQGFYIPITYYDFMFGRHFELFGVVLKQEILWFILLNICVFTLLYVFVRVMEANADFIVKRAGLGNQLAKALYNLESFYALGKQAGLNVMLLAEEKLDEDHEIMNYISASRTINKQLYVPSKGSLLGNLLNSHPLTSFRIANMLLPRKKEFSAMQMTFLPAKLLRKKNCRRFAIFMEDVRKKFDEISRTKFMELFGKKVGDSLSRFLETLKLEGDTSWYKNRQFLSRKIIAEKLEYIEILGVQYQDSISVPFKFVVRKINNNGGKPAKNDEEKHEPEFYKYFLLPLKHCFFLKDYGYCVLSGVRDQEKEKKVTCNFKLEEGKTISVPFKKVKNLISVDTITSFNGKNVFLLENDVIKVLTCEKVNKVEKLADYEIIARPLTPGNTKTIKLRDYKITTEYHVMPIHTDGSYYPLYLQFFSWALSSEKFLKIVLRKPVNNDFYGKITYVEIEKNSIKMVDVFDKEITMTLSMIDYVFFEFATAIFKSFRQETFIHRILYSYRRWKRSVPWIPK
ncbi:MAG: M48 family metalloprotease [Promethearchaeota archaeon]